MLRYPARISYEQRLQTGVILAPSVAMADLVSKDYAGRVTALSHHFVSDHHDQAAFFVARRARNHEGIDARTVGTPGAQFLETIRHHDREVASIFVIKLGWREDQILDFRSGDRFNGRGGDRLGG